jgi:hypothetical protein
MAMLEREDRHPEGSSDSVVQADAPDGEVPSPPSNDGDAAKEEKKLPLSRHLHDLWVALGLDD